MNKLIQYAVMVAVGVLVFATLLVPIINDAEKTTETVTNAGVYNMTDDDSDYTLVYNGLSGTINANGTVIQRDSIPAGAWTLVSTPDYMIRLQNYAAQSYNLWIFGINGFNRVIGNVETDGVTLNIVSGSITLDTETWTYNGEFRGIDPNGSYVMTDGQPFTVNKTDSIIVGNGTTPVSVWYDLFYMIGTVDDMNVTSKDTITISNVVVNSTPLSKYTSGVSVESITFTATEGTNNANATYNRVIAPAEVTLELAVHADDSTRAIIGVIPLIVIVGLIAGIIGVIAVRRGA